MQSHFVSCTLVIFCVAFLRSAVAADNNCSWNTARDGYSNDTMPIWYSPCAPCKMPCPGQPPIACSKICKPGCGCPHGTYYFKGKCVKGKDCPAIPECKNGMVWYEDCAPCLRDCDKTHGKCSKKCTPGCSCPPRQVFQGGKCISKNLCPRKKCKWGMKWFPDCAPCNERCPGKRKKSCKKICRPGCGCPENTYLHRRKCIRKEQCPKKKCKNGKRYFEQCAPCDNVCPGEKQKICLAVCKPGCACPRGRSLHKGKCIWSRRCPKQKCKNGMKWYSSCRRCNQSCPGEKHLPCDKKCRSGCACPQNTYFHNGRCIKSRYCPRKKCKNGMRWFSECAPCNQSCEGQKKNVCNEICEAGCACPTNKFLYKGNCVSKRSCPRIKCKNGMKWFGECAPCDHSCPGFGPTLCTSQCTSGCRCPISKFLHEGSCIPIEKCPHIDHD